MRLVTAALVGAALVAISLAQPMRAEQRGAAGASATFVNIPGLPTCVKGAVKEGDPSNGAFVILGKMRTGCVVPWHWHTTKEQLMMISGGARVEMKDSAPATLRPADYLNLPPKHQHQFTCQTACTLFIASDGAFDIHYIDAKGNEIPQEEALKAAPHKSPKSAR